MCHYIYINLLGFIIDFKWSHSVRVMLEYVRKVSDWRAGPISHMLLRIRYVLYSGRSVIAETITQRGLKKGDVGSHWSEPIAYSYNRYWKPVGSHWSEPIAYSYNRYWKPVGSQWLEPIAYSYNRYWKPVGSQWSEPIAYSYNRYWKPVGSQWSEPIGYSYNRYWKPVGSQWSEPIGYSYNRYWVKSIKYITK